MYCNDTMMFPDCNNHSAVCDVSVVTVSSTNHTLSFLFRIVGTVVLLQHIINKLPYC